MPARFSRLFAGELHYACQITDRSRANAVTSATLDQCRATIAEAGKITGHPRDPCGAIVCQWIVQSQAGPGFATWRCGGTAEAPTATGAPHKLGESFSTTTGDCLQRRPSAGGQ